MYEIFVNVSGWSGFLFCALGYFLLNLKIITHDSTLYQFLNAMGAVGLLISAWSFSDTPNFIANLVWLFIALYGIIRYNKKLRFWRRIRFTQAK